MNKIFFVLAVALVSIFTACKKTGDLVAPRLIRPQIAEPLSADSNTIVASWLKVSGAKSYLLQVSRDTFKTIDLSLALDTNIAVIKKLLFNQLYQLQIKTVAPNTDMDSRWSNLGAVKTLSSILKVPGIDDITFNSVRVRWTTKGAAVSSIKILKTSDSSLVAQATLTVADVAGEFKIINGLQAETKYTILLYSSADVRGYIDFTSKAPFTGSVIDLTAFTGRPSILADTLAVVPPGSTILLKRGETYNIASAINLNKSLIIMSGPDLATTLQAKIFFTSNFGFVAGATIDSLEFNDVYMYSDNYSSRYVFNTTNSASVGKIKFMNSRVEIFRGMLRLQSGTTTVSNFIIDNCIIDSLAGYGILTVGTTTTKVENVSITRSTIYKAEVVISSAQASTSLLIDACTFHEAPLGNSNSYYINYGSLNVTNGIMISNCIFGYGKNSAGAVTVRDFRAGTATTLVASNNYRTSDHLSAGNDFSNITVSNRTASQLWLDPINGNFKIMDNTFSGRNTAGDPRWRP